MIHKFFKTITVSSGSGAANTIGIDGICRLIYIEPTTATTTYKFNITDADGDVIKSWDFTQGTYRDYTPVILYGINTFNITNSDADEDFSVKLLVEELLRG
jgi:hypothetical protein